MKFLENNVVWVAVLAFAGVVYLVGEKKSWWKKTTTATTPAATV